MVLGFLEGEGDRDGGRLFVRKLILITDGEGVLGNSVSFVV